MGNMVVIKMEYGTVKMQTKLTVKEGEKVGLKFLEMVVNKKEHKATEMKEEQGTRKYKVFWSFRNRQKSPESFLEGGWGIIGS